MRHGLFSWVLLWNVLHETCLGVGNTSTYNEVLHFSGAITGHCFQSNILAYVVYPGFSSSTSSCRRNEFTVRWKDTCLKENSCQRVLSNSNGNSNQLSPLYATDGTKRRQFLSRKKKGMRKHVPKKQEKVEVNILSSATTKAVPNESNTDEGEKIVTEKGKRSIGDGMGTSCETNPVPISDSSALRSLESVETKKDAIPHLTDIKPNSEQTEATSTVETADEEGSLISNRRLHFLQTLFSDEHELNTRQVAVMLHDLLGEPDSKVLEIIDNIGKVSRDGGERNPLVAERAVEDNNTQALKKLIMRKSVSGLFVSSPSDGTGATDVGLVSSSDNSQPHKGTAISSASSASDVPILEATNTSLLLDAIPQEQDDILSKYYKDPGSHEHSTPEVKDAAATTSSIDSFIVSIPMAHKNTTKKVDTKRAENLKLDAPVTLFTLKRGFLGEIYSKYLRPSLISVLEKCFKVTLDAPCGVMDFDRLDVDKVLKDDPMDRKFERAILYRYLRNVVVYSLLEDGNKDVIEYQGTSVEMPKETRARVAQLFKWIKDQVFINASVNFLTKLIGRLPTTPELAFALGHSNPKQLATAITVCSSYVQRAFEGLSTPIGELTMLKLEKEWNIERKNKKGPLELMDPHMFNTHGVVHSTLWERFRSIHLNTLSNLGERALSQIYAFALSAARNDVFKERLPIHMPIGKYRLARRAKVTEEDLYELQGRVISEFRMSKRLGIAIPENLYEDDPFAQQTLEIERSYSEADEGSTEEFMRHKAHRLALIKEMEKRLQVSWEHIDEALKGLHIRERGSSAIGSGKDMPSRFSSSSRSKRRSILKNEDMYPDADENVEPFNPWSMEHLRDRVLTKSLRMLANEALDDRIARYLFMAKHGLFTQGIIDDDELASVLGISDMDVFHFIYYAARSHCMEYEVWRIKLKLPPYVDETREFPSLTRYLDLQQGKTMPHHIATAIRKKQKTLMAVRHLSGGNSNLHSPKCPSMKDRYKRLRSIKPRMGTMKDSLLYYRENEDSIHKTLQTSPIYYLLENFSEDMVQPDII